MPTPCRRHPRNASGTTAYPRRSGARTCRNSPVTSATTYGWLFGGMPQSLYVMTDTASSVLAITAAGSEGSTV
jgi:hypothetical protein